MICGGLTVAVDVPAPVEPAPTIDAELSLVVALDAAATGAVVAAAAPAPADVVACVSGVCAANCHFSGYRL